MTMANRGTIKEMNLKEKAEILVELTNQVIDEIMSDECRMKSKNNQNVASIVGLFEQQYKGYVGNLKRQIDRLE